jgi:hypothetical protein
MSHRIAQYEKEKMQRLQNTTADDLSFRRFDENTDDIQIINSL